MNNNSDPVEKALICASSAFGVSVEEIKSSSRLRPVSDSRKAIAHVLRKHFQLGSKNISDAMHKNHCIVNYMLRQAEILIKHDPKYKYKIDMIETSMGLRVDVCPCCNRPYENNAKDGSK